MKHFKFTQLCVGMALTLSLLMPGMLHAQTGCGCEGTPLNPVVLHPDMNCMTRFDSTDLDDLTPCVGPYMFTVIHNGAVVAQDTDSLIINLIPYIGEVLQVEFVALGNNMACFSFYEIIDDTSPMLLCPSDTVTCTEYPDSVRPIVVIEDCSIVTITPPVDSIGDLDCAGDFYRRVFRSYSASDGSGNTTSCTQEVLIYTADTSEVAFPKDTVLDCNTPFGDTITGRPTLNGVPFVNTSLCNLQLFTDETIDTLNCGNLLIRRQWTFVDDCNSNKIKSDTQLIRLVDTIPPVFAPCLPSYTFNADQFCMANPVVPLPNVTDNCSAVSVSAIIEVNNSVVNGVTTGGGIVFTGLTEGTFPLVFTATDACGNVSTCSSSIQIVDVTTPNAVCEGGLVVSLDNNGNALLFAADVDDGSNDACGHPLDFMISRSGMNFTEFITLDCNDALLDSVMVTLLVIDLNIPSSTNICMTSIRVEDKIAPALTCPAPVTVDCGTDYSDLSIFGSPPVLFDACGISVQLDSAFDIGQCGTGTITRIWTVTDPGGNVSFCDQTITLANLTPFDGTGIVWPEDYLETVSCTTPADLEPADLPAGFDVPVVPADPCAMIATSYHDQLFYIDFPACYKIVRTWKVIDWCQFSTTDPTVGRWEEQQVIAVMDTLPPTITTCPVNDTFELNDACTFAPVFLQPVTALGDCPNEDITITNDSPFAFANGGDASGNYPAGVHTIHFTATDGCGNKATCSVTVTVADLKPPTIVCKDGIVGELAFMPNASPQIMAVINAEQLNEYSSDNCTPTTDLTYTMRFVGDTSPPVPSVVFDCAGEGFHDVEIWVTDESGNADFCITVIEIQDNMNLCQDDTLSVSNGMIGGNVHTPTGDLLPEVHVDMTSMSMSYMTDDEGRYEFHNLATGNDYTVEPWKNDNPKNGVTTYDIVLIARHVLNIHPLDSPYKLIAADVNNSGSVTTFDIVELRKLILGIYSDFPDNSSWRFVRADYDFPNDDDPFEPPFPEVINVNNFTADIPHADFVGVKIGDVNGSASANYDETNDDRNSENLNILMEDRDLKAGETFTVPVRLQNEENLLALQFTLEFETDLELQGFEKGVLARVARDRFVTSQQGKGIMTGFWFHTSPVVATTEDTLFSLRFFSKKEGRLSDRLSLSSRITEAIAFDEEELPLNLNLVFSNPTNMQTDLSFQLFQNQPNPFKRFTNISFNLPQAGPATLTIFDVSGNVLKTYNKVCQKGFNEVSIMRHELPSGGVLFYQLQTPTHTATRKMILL